MTAVATRPRTRLQRLRALWRVVVYSFLTSFSVLLVALFIQWAVDDDWLHQSGPLRIVGTVIAAVTTFGFVFHWQTGLEERHREALHRFKRIGDMNDRIRNALQ